MDFSPHSLYHHARFFFLFRIVKLSSPNLNYLIIFGAGILYASVYMYIYTAHEDQTAIQTALCNVRTAC